MFFLNVFKMFELLTMWSTLSRLEHWMHYIKKAALPCLYIKTGRCVSLKIQVLVFSWRRLSCLFVLNCSLILPWEVPQYPSVPGKKTLRINMSGPGVKCVSRIGTESQAKIKKKSTKVSWWSLVRRSHEALRRESSHAWKWSGMSLHSD